MTLAQSNLLLLFTAAIWGGSFVIQKVAMDSMDPFIYNALRFFVASLCLIPIRYFRRGNIAIMKDGENRHMLTSTFAAGTIMFVAVAFQQIGIKDTTVSNAGFITGLYIVFVPIIGIFIGHRYKHGIWIAIGIACIGLYLLSGMDGFYMKQGDFFIASINEIKTKHAREMMEVNWASLDTKKRNNEIFYQWDGGESFLRVFNDSEWGMATIWDHDVLLFIVSQLVAKSERGEEISKKFWFSGGEFLSFIGRSTKSRGGQAYKEIWAKLNRLNTTFVSTSIRTSKKRTQTQWNWLSEIYEGKSDDEAHLGFEVVLADWIFRAVQDRSLVLTLDDRYFSLRGGLERWLYMWCRKAAGRQKAGWTETYESIWRKSGMECSLKEFNRKMRTLIKKHDGFLLEYHLAETVIYQRGRSYAALEVLHLKHWSEMTRMIPGDQRTVGDS